MDKQHWSGLSYLDALRPEPGWKVERAILATYSADLIAVVASLLALAGLDDDRGSGSKVDFANAYEQLRDRVKILVQAGRLAWPGKKIPVLAILDRFIQEVTTDEEKSSWHPKAALVKLIDEDNRDTAWRLWVGSRNLTRSLDWDAGLILTGCVGGTGQSIPGIADLAAGLADLAGLRNFSKNEVRQEIEHLQWQSPPGTHIQALQLLTHHHGQRRHPVSPGNLKKLFVISPFIDGEMITNFGSWANDTTESYLLSTQRQLARLHKQSGQPLAAFDYILSLESPDTVDNGILPTSSVPEQAAEPNEDEEIEARGLHAKLVYAETEADQRVLWLGSANATARGWHGPNTEVIAQLTIDASIAEGLEVFLREIARPVDLANLTDADEEDAVEKQLEEARKMIVTRWQVIQKRHNTGPLLVATVTPHPKNKDIQLEVGLLACDLVVWPPRKKVLKLPPISKAQETELVQIRLSLGDYHVTWLQRAPLDPPPDEERDRHALARHLDPRTFLLWIRSLLNEDNAGDGGGDWDSVTPVSHQKSTVVLFNWWAPTLEEVLKAWTRNPDTLRVIDRKVQDYLKLMHDKDEVKKNPEVRQLLNEFESTWTVLHEVLIEEQA
ncbi:MAG: hypothetical protein KDJ65_34020 [Anaerolineae bacterium]|nr:hypothetical protein [Anaerolineae bacterium]